MAGKQVFGPWFDQPPKKPRVGAGREALARRAKAKGGRERKKSAEAARRGLNRTRKKSTKGGRGGLRKWGPAAELMRFSRVFEQKFLNRQRLRHMLLAVAAVWVLWTFLFGDAGLPRLFWVQHENARAQAEIEELSVQEAALKDTVSALSDPRDQKALERVAREEHALVRDGEVLVHFYVEEESE